MLKRGELTVLALLERSRLQAASCKIRDCKALEIWKALHETRSFEKIITLRAVVSPADAT